LGGGDDLQGLKSNIEILLDNLICDKFALQMLQETPELLQHAFIQKQRGDGASVLLSFVQGQHWRFQCSYVCCADPIVGYQLHPRSAGCTFGASYSSAGDHDAGIATAIIVALSERCPLAGRCLYI
jgi:hypothetical protein